MKIDLLTMLYENIIYFVIIFITLLLLWVLWRFLLELNLSKEQTIEYTFDMIMYAEEYLKSATGKDKLDFVTSKISSMLPVFLQPVITPKLLNSFVQNIFDIMKEELTEIQSEMESEENE